LTNLKYIRVWHKTDLVESIAGFRKILTDEKKLWRIITEDDLT